MLRVPPALLGLVVLFVVGVVPAAAAPQPAPATVIQDDAVFLHGTDQEIRTAVQQVRALGIERVRLTAGWSVIAPQPDVDRVPQGDLSDPDAYPPESWSNLDRAVRYVIGGGLSPMIDIAFWAPRWAAQPDATRPDRPRTQIDPAQYARFAHAVAVRYAGDVDLFTIWNEPNHPGFVMPQWVRSGSGFVPSSPQIYRRMVQAAYPAIKDAAPYSRVLIGGTSSFGSSTPGRGGVPPLQFLRALACVDEQLRPITTGDCEHFTPVPGDGWSHHPYSLKTTPDVQPRNPDNAPVANTPRLARLLRRLVAAGRLAPGVANIYMTEYGYETNPPDPGARFSAEQQPQLLAWAESIATRTPQVVMWPQFLLRDRPALPAGAPKEPFGDWQTGLYDAAGNPKPAAAAFRTPAFARCVQVGGRRVVEVWGRVRGDDTPARAAVQTRQATGDGGWSPLASGSHPGENAELAIRAAAVQPDATIRRYVPWRPGQQLRLDWLSANSTATITHAVAVQSCPPKQSKRGRS
jgi:hypothetical protein